MPGTGQTCAIAIPGKDGSVEPQSRQILSQVDEGHSVRVARVRDDDPALLRYLGELGIVPNATITVAERSPFDGPVHVRVGEGAGFRSPVLIPGRRRAGGDAEASPRADPDITSAQ